MIRRKEVKGLFLLLVSITVFFGLSSVGCKKKSEKPEPTVQAGFPSSTTGQTTFTNPADAATKTFGSLSVASDNIITARASQSEMITGRMITGRAITARIITGRIITARSPKFINVIGNDNDDDEDDILNLFGRLKKGRLSKKQSEGSEISCEDVKPKCVEGKVEKAYCNQSTNRLNFDIKLSDCKEIVDEQKGDYIVSTGYVKGYLEVSTKVSQNISDARFTVAIEDGDSLVKEFIGNKETKRVRAKASNFRTEITGRFIEGEKDVDFRVVTKLSGAYSREDEIGNRKEAYSYNDYVVELTGRSPKSGGEPTLHMSIAGGYSVDTEPDSCVEGAFNFKTIKPVKSSGQGYCGIESGEIEVNNARMEFSSGKVKVSVENQQKEYGCEELGGLCKYKPITIAEGVEQKPCPVWFKDKDKDGYTDGTTKVSCTKPSDEYVSSATAGDCNDDDPDMHLGKAEICDNKDNNCDGLIDEGVKLVFYKDLDGDGYTDGTTQVGCTAPTGYVLSATPGDCDDNDPNIRTCPPSSWLAGWGYRRAIRISNYSSSSLTDYQVLISNPVYNEDGLVLSFHFNEGSGTVAYDSSGNGNNGNLVNGPTWVDGKFGKALSFDGVNDYVEANDSIGTFSYLTIAAWFKLNSLPSSYATIYFNGDGSGGNDIHLAITSDGAIFSRADAPSECDISIWKSSSGLVSPGNWYHVVVVFDTVNDVKKVYLNGTLVQNVTYTCSIPTANYKDEIGRAYDNSFLNNWYFNGVIDEVRIYNRALSDVEIQALYQAKARLDYGDIRFADSDGSTQLNYWQEVDGKFWVKVPSIPASTTKTIYVYYGNPNTTSLSNPDATMFIYEDYTTPPRGSFAGSATYDTANKWVQLTPNSGDQEGYLYYAKVPTNPTGFYAKFYFWAGGGSGADAIWLGAYDTDYTSTREDIVNGGYHFTYDEYQDRICFTKSTLDNGAGIACASETTIDNSSWHLAEIYFWYDGSRVCTKIYYDRTLKVNACDTSVQSNVINGVGQIIFGGRTGWNYNYHRIGNRLLYVAKYISPEPTISLGAEEVLSGGGSAPYIREQSSLGDVEQKQTRYGCSSADIVFYVLYLIFPAFILFALLKRRFFVRN
jgi:hypothetical protein